MFPSLRLSPTKTEEITDGILATVEIIRNQITGEGVYLLTLNYNDVLISLAINEMDLEGEPQPGRRFKGNIWLQGRTILPRGDKEQ